MSWIGELFSSAARNLEDRRIGIEIERLGMWNDLEPFLYSQKNIAGKLRPGAEQLLSTLSQTYKWPLIQNQWGLPLGLTTPWGKVTLEPGSQVELSADPCADLIEMKSAVDQFETKVKAITEKWGLSWIGLGLNPLHSIEEIDLIPSPRYAIMTKYFEKSGKLGTTMMRRTTSVQLNLDYSSEEEAIEMLRVALSVSPVSYALFANSPFLDRKETGFLSFRSEVWRQTDPYRTGLIPEAFEKDFSFEKYADFLWNRPLMFAQDKTGTYVAAHGKSLAQIEKGELPDVCIDEHNQWNAVRELFTEARIKPGYIEIRNIDGLMPEDRDAAAAFWTGILYGKEARSLALKLLGSLPAEEKNRLWIDSTKVGLNTKLGKADLRTIAKELLVASHASLKARGKNEETFLAPLLDSKDSLHSPAEILLNRFRQEWGMDMRKVIEATRF